MFQHDGCLKTFTNKSNLNVRARRIHEKNRANSAFTTFVESHFFKSQNLDRHMDNAHVDGDKRRFECYKCQRRFKDKSNMHM